MGAETLTPLQDTLVPAGRGAGGSVQDLSFIPQYRDDPGVTTTQPDCASLTWRRDAILNGHPAQALKTWPADFTTARPGNQTGTGCHQHPAGRLRGGSWSRTGRHHALMTVRSDRRRPAEPVALGG